MCVCVCVCVLGVGVGVENWWWKFYPVCFQKQKGRPRGMVRGGRREEGSGWGTHVYLWRIHFDIWQNQYNIVKFKNKIKLKSILKKTKNKVLMVEPLKTSKTEDWIMQGQFLLLIFQSFNSFHLLWGRMIRKDRNVYRISRMLNGGKVFHHKQVFDYSCT